MHAGRLRFLLVNVWRNLDTDSPVQCKPLAVLHPASCGATYHSGLFEVPNDWGVATLSGRDPAYSEQ